MYLFDIGIYASIIMYRPLKNLNITHNQDIVLHKIVESQCTLTY